jgi:hypothetical protein
MKSVATVGTEPASYAESTITQTSPADETTDAGSGIAFSMSWPLGTGFALRRLHDLFAAFHAESITPLAPRPAHCTRTVVISFADTPTFSLKSWKAL